MQGSGPSGTVPGIEEGGMGHLEERGGLAGRTAAVLGGASGIGEAVSVALARAGVDVALCDCKSDAVPATVARLHEIGRRSLGVVADTCDSAALKRFYDEISTTFGHLDIVVHVAGGTVRKAFMDMDVRDYSADIRRNYEYVLESTRLAVPLLRRSGRGGSIINFTTIEAHRGAAGFAVYAGAKAALTNFTRALAVELGSERIRVNALAPDTTPSEGNFLAIPEPLRSRMAAVPGAQMMRAFRMYVPLKEPPMPENLADGVIFLASDLSRFVTGTTLHVDGGTMAAAGFIDWPYGDGHLPVPGPSSARRLFGGEAPPDEDP
jgi:NAD(P)-dependent dehydrogenase (short-subunit alcohol dehydrogenase family)